MPARANGTGRREFTVSGELACAWEELGVCRKWGQQQMETRRSTSRAGSSRVLEDVRVLAASAME